MSNSINLVVLRGNLGRDPELRYTGNGTAVVNFSLATNKSFQNEDGEYQQRTEWHNAVAFGRMAEIIGERAVKGSDVQFTGELQTRSWEDREGNTRYTTEVKLTGNLNIDNRHLEVEYEFDDDDEPFTS